MVNVAFYDFCGFRSVAVNSVYKLQFFTFIFAVLLPVLSRLLIMSINTTFFSIFQDGCRRHLGFAKFQIFNGRSGQEGRNCVIVSNFTEIAQTAPSRICDVCVGTTHEGTFVVFITVQKFGWLSRRLALSVSVSYGHRDKIHLT